MDREDDREPCSRSNYAFGIASDVCKGLDIKMRLNNLNEIKQEQEIHKMARSKRAANTSCNVEHGENGPARDSSIARILVAVLTITFITGLHYFRQRRARQNAERQVALAEDRYQSAELETLQLRRELEMKEEQMQVLQYYASQLEATIASNDENAKMLCPDEDAKSESWHSAGGASGSESPRETPAPGPSSSKERGLISFFSSKKGN